MHDWSQILERYGPVVWKQALRMLGNESDAADCLQNVMLEAFEFSQHQQVQSWPGLLKRLATVRSLDLLRSRYRRSADPLPAAELNDPSSTQGTDLVDKRDLAESLRREISRLPPDQAEAFTLRWVEGLTNEDVAHSMQITTNHAGVLLHRARTTLRERLSRKQEHSP